jgi:hypothetical protein
MPLSLAAAATALPQYEAILPESGNRVEYRPFLVKEEKILYMAAETKNLSASLPVRDSEAARPQTALEIFKTTNGT